MRAPWRFGAMLAILAAGTGCAGSGNFIVLTAPQRPVEAYNEIQVSELALEVTIDSISRSDLLEVRGSILEAISDQDHVSAVRTEGESQDGWLSVDCTIKEFDKGSRAARWFLGRFGGGAVLTVDCDFRDLGSDSVIASAQFQSEVKGGLFGGGADADGMGSNLAKDVADFLKRGGRR